MPKKVIVVEDEPLLLKALNLVLLDAGFDTVTATDGEMGLRLVQKFQPDIVLLDLVLPKMHGFEVLKSLKKIEETRQIPVIILSNLSQKEECLQGLDLGAEDYFIKSNTDLSEVVKKIKSVLGI